MVDAIIRAIENNPLMQIIIASGVVLWLIYRVDGVFKALIGWLRTRRKGVLPTHDTQENVKVILARIEARMQHIEQLQIYHQLEDIYDGTVAQRTDDDFRQTPE